MKALVYRKSIPRYAALKLLGRRFRGIYTSGVSPVGLREIPEPSLPSPDWVRIAPTLSGICGSDIATLCAKGSPYLAPVTSMPFVLGHELVGRVVEIGGDVSRVSVGDRVVIHPALGCKVRGIEPACDSCAADRDALCRNVTRGDIAPGIQTGYCRDTGGGFGQRLVAHASQCYAVPDALSDESAVLVEPFSCALHGVLRANIEDSDTVLVIGAGAIGLLTVAALRATDCKARIVVVAKYDHQRQHALGLGADELLDATGSTGSRYATWSATLGCEVLPPELGKPTVIGGADVVFDCVASSQSIDDGLRFTRSGGTFVLVGMPGIPRNVDWTPMWFKELTVHASYAYGPEVRKNGTSDTFDVAIEVMGSWGKTLSKLVSEPFPLESYREAFASAINTSRSRSVKTVFAINDG